MADDARPTPIQLDEAFARLTFLPDRTPETPDHAANLAFAQLDRYRDGAIFIGHYAGNSDWERHPNGDEVVMVVDGATTIFLVIGGEELAYGIGPGQLIVVPRGVWHRFETPQAVKVLTVTPQPTDHRIDPPY